jgi:hypothetical protein
VVVADIANGEQPAPRLQGQPGQDIEPVPVLAPESASSPQKERQGEPVAHRRGVPAQPGRVGSIGPSRRDRRPH